MKFRKMDENMMKVMHRNFWKIVFTTVRIISKTKRVTLFLETVQL